MPTWVPLCPSCRVPLREGVEIHEPPGTEESLPSGSITITCRFCDQEVLVDGTTKWARVA